MIANPMEADSTPPRPQIIWIARHGNRADFVDPDWSRTAERPFDPPLSEDGLVQAQRLARRLQGEGISHIFASPFLRTVQTANETAELLDLPLLLEEGLSEWLNPYWMPAPPERLPLDQLCEEFPRIDRAYTSRVQAHYPETGPEALHRSGETARRLADEFGDDILLVGHGASVLGATMGLVHELADNEIQASLCCLIKIVRHDLEWVLELKGDTSHLTEVEEVVRFN